MTEDGVGNGHLADLYVNIIGFQILKEQINGAETRGLQAFTENLYVTQPNTKAAQSLKQRWVGGLLEQVRENQIDQLPTKRKTIRPAGSSTKDEYGRLAYHVANVTTKTTCVNECPARVATLTLPSSISFAHSAGQR